ncbi:MAG: hypothetical protein J6T74_08930 [Clostridia bacterium]|nr:hypothetical protein [Clostridia bacterium]
MGRVVLATYEKHWNGGIIDYYEIYAEGSGNTELKMSESGWTDGTNGIGKSFAVTHFSNQGGAYPHLFVSFNESVQIFQTVTRNTTMEPYTSRISTSAFDILSGDVYSRAFSYWEYNNVKAPIVSLSVNFIQSNPDNLELNPLIKVCDTVQEYVEWVSTYNPPVSYNWKSIKSLSLGNMDNYVDWRPYTTSNSTLLLSYIPDEDLETLDINTPVTNATNFVLKSPSLEEVMVDFNDTSMTERVLKLSNGNYALVGIQSGLLSHSYQIKFYIGGQQFPQLIYTGTFSTSSGNPYLGFLIDSESEAVKLNIIFSHYLYDSAYGTQTHVVDYNTISMSSSEMGLLYEWLYGSSGEEEHTDDSQENPIHGGEESDQVINTPLSRPGLPVKGAVGSGFVKLYHVSDTQLQDLCEFMWDDSLLTNLGRLFNDPREIIVGIMVFPFQPTHVTADAHIYAGNLDTGVLGDLLNTEYEQFYMGYCDVPVGDADFMSFAPYRKIHIFIPYCGEHDLDPSAVYGCRLKLYYHVSFFSGNVIAEITRTQPGSSEEEPMWFFPGQIGFQVPLSGEDFTRTISTLVQAGITGMTGIAMKNPATILKGVGQLFSGNLAPSVQYSGAGGANASFLGCQQPHLIFSTPKKAYDGDQDEYIGNTYHKTKRLGDCNGYTKCFEAHIEGLDATSYELEEIERWLTSGVIIRSDGSSTPSGTPSQPGFIPIHFMHCESERNVIGKKWDTPTVKEGKLLYEQSISTPIVLIEGNMIGYNYCYIDLFKRFYWIKDVKAMKNTMTEVHLEVDPLQSFDNDLRDCYASVDRQATDSVNAFVEDPYKWIQVNHDVSIVPFKDSGLPVDFDHQMDSYILTIAGT